MTTTASEPSSAAAATRRILNFSAGPAVLPEPVLEQAREDIWSIAGSGIGIMEHSHRGKVFDRVIEEAEADCRAIAAIPDDFEVLFLQGGATLQFTMIPMSFLPESRIADYPDTGVWTTKAIKDARPFGQVNVAFEGKSCGYDHTPAEDELHCSDNAVYLHYCSNNTIYGTRYNEPPRTDAPLVCDASSEMFSRPLDLAPHAIIYAGAQKNLGPAGVTLVLIRKSFMEQARDDVPGILDYRQHAAKGSRLNTPPTFGVYICGQVFKWIRRQGGLDGLARRNDEKAKLVYDAIDASGGFYQGVSKHHCRSVMNVTFRTPDAQRDAAFLEEAKRHEMDGLKGHRDVGGLRASIYNAFPVDGCRTLAEFMADFAARHG